VAAGVARAEVASVVGATTESIRQWVKRAKEAGTFPDGERVESEASGEKPRPRKKRRKKTRSGSRNPGGETTPTAAEGAEAGEASARDPGQGLAGYEVDAILALKRKRPSMGPAQIRAQLKRFKGWRIALKAIARVLRAHGYEPVHTGGRPWGPEPVRFEAPRPNAIWMADWCEVRVGTDRFWLLVIIDDFSRFVVGWFIADTPDSTSSTEALKVAIARHGKPEAVRTDRGGAFLAYREATHFARFLEAELIEHIVGRSYNPKGGGKVEAVIKTVRRELWDVEEFEDRDHARQRLAEFFLAYNEERAHMGIDGLTPADRYFGRADRVLEAINAISRGRPGALSEVGKAVEEHGPGAPLEVLRLVVTGDKSLELRFCGVTVPLGRVALPA
jgi:transposase InsO family protein